MVEETIGDGTRKNSFISTSNLYATFLQLLFFTEDGDPTYPHVGDSLKAVTPLQTALHFCLLYLSLLALTMKSIDLLT